ncbi:hypothetical protein SteCoe_36178 [Stentor coeruleus]|uniref:Uncharacterized protein n=1 Tax=Stentor coeruleus TaxID=5963 RepID=A0A1R2AQS4_9CILI|nr:hypothetical protein SteCoe_36178 [Stentor coeruleus]
MSEIEDPFVSNRILQMLTFGSDNYVLNKFRHANSRKVLKKEFLRAQLIRAFKRALRQISQGKKLPIKSKLHSFDSKNQQALRIWNILKDFYYQNEELQSICLTTNGPKTDGKSKPKPENIEKSFNSKFCQKFFSQEIVRKCFSYYLELIFLPFEPKVLCKKFNFLCCDEKHHSIDCLYKWDIMKKYLDVLFIIELGLEPQCQFEVVSLPCIDFCIGLIEKNSLRFYY